MSVPRPYELLVAPVHVDGDLNQGEQMRMALAVLAYRMGTGGYTPRQANEVIGSAADEHPHAGELFGLAFMLDGRPWRVMVLERP